MQDGDDGTLGFSLCADCIYPSCPILIFVNQHKARTARKVYQVVIQMNKELSKVRCKGKHDTVDPWQFFIGLRRMSGALIPFPS